jgi:hypothetical protein
VWGSHSTWQLSTRGVCVWSAAWCVCRPGLGVASGQRGESRATSFRNVSLCLVPLSLWQVFATPAQARAHANSYPGHVKCSRCGRCFDDANTCVAHVFKLHKVTLKEGHSGSEWQRPGPGRPRSYFTRRRSKLARRPQARNFARKSSKKAPSPSFSPSFCPSNNLLHHLLGKARKSSEKLELL